MDPEKPLSIGVFDASSHFVALFHTLLTPAGHKVTFCSASTLSVFLEDTFKNFQQRHTSPYDVLLLVVPSSTLERQTSVRLARLLSLERLPVLLCTEGLMSEEQPFLFCVRLTPILSRYLIPVTEFLKTLESATGRTFPLSETMAQKTLDWQREQCQQAVQTHQGWLDQRQQWLRQRQEWLGERRAWLIGRGKWLDLQRQQPHAQQEWFEEQEAWIKAQQQEISQQEQWLCHQQIWLAEQQQKLDRLPLPFSKET